MNNDLIYGAIPRHDDWDDFRDLVVKERGSRCEISGATTDLEAHHIIPFHYCIWLDLPQLELEPRNLIVLSGSPINYHLLLGHLGDFSTYNPYITNIKKWKSLIKHFPRLKDSPFWQGCKKRRPKFIKDMGEKEKRHMYNKVCRMFNI